MSHLSPQLRTEDLPQAAIIVANMVDTFLDAQKRSRSDVDMEVEYFLMKMESTTRLISTMGYCLV